MRHNCGALKAHRRPPVNRRGHRSWMKASGTYGDTNSSKRWVPVGGSKIAMPEL